MTDCAQQSVFAEAPNRCLSNGLAWMENSCDAPQFAKAVVAPEEIAAQFDAAVRFLATGSQKRHGTERPLRVETRNSQGSRDADTYWRDVQQLSCAGTGPCGTDRAPRRLRRHHHPKPLPRLAPEFARRHALDLQEAPVEVGDVVEADVVADVGDVVVGLHQ